MSAGRRELSETNKFLLRLATFDTTTCAHTAVAVPGQMCCNIVSPHSLPTCLQ